MKTLKVKNAIQLLAVMFLVSISSAATISWSVNDVTGDSDVYNAGTLVYAYAQQQQGSQTVNGVFFDDYSNGASNFTLTSVGGVGVSNSFYTGGAYSTALNTFLGAEYYASGNTTAAVTMTLNNLTIGVQYVVNTFTSHDTAGWENWYTSTIDATSIPSLGGTGNIPKVLLGTFTADATTQSYTITGSRAVGGGVYASLSGFSLSSVPEPSTYLMLLILGSFGVVALRKRARKMI